MFRCVFIQSVSRMVDSPIPKAPGRLCGKALLIQRRGGTFSFDLHSPIASAYRARPTPVRHLTRQLKCGAHFSTEPVTCPVVRSRAAHHCCTLPRAVRTEPGSGRPPLTRDAARPRGWYLRQYWLGTLSHLPFGLVGERRCQVPDAPALLAGRGRHVAARPVSELALSNGLGHPSSPSAYSIAGGDKRAQYLKLIAPRTAWNVRSWL